MDFCEAGPGLDDEAGALAGGGLGDLLAAGLAALGVAAAFDVSEKTSLLELLLLLDDLPAEEEFVGVGFQAPRATSP